MFATIVTDATAACRPSQHDVVMLAITYDLPITVAWSWISEPQIALGVGHYNYVGRNS